MCQPEPINKVNELFNTLDDWRKLPKYALERRADIFFAVYLKEILNKCLKNPKPVIEHIIPEFPLKKEKNCRSNNIDYLCLSNNETLYFIELKTDNESIDKDQLKRMLKYKGNNNVDRLIENLKEITTHSTLWQKYYHIFRLLYDSNLLDFKLDLFDEMEQLVVNSESDNSRKNFNKAVKKIKLKNELKTCEIKCVYVIPHYDKRLDNEKIDVITFNDIIGKFTKNERKSDKLLDRFLLSLST